MIKILPSWEGVRYSYDPWFSAIEFSGPRCVPQVSAAARAFEQAAAALQRGRKRKARKGGDARRRLASRAAVGPAEPWAVGPFRRRAAHFARSSTSLKCTVERHLNDPARPRPEPEIHRVDPEYGSTFRLL